MTVHRHDDDTKRCRVSGRVRFGIVKCLDGYGGDAVFVGELFFSVAASLAANEKWNLVEFLLGIRGPDDGIHVRRNDRRRLGPSNGWRCGGGRMSGTQMRRHSAVLEFEIVLEHRQQMFFQAHHQRMHPGIEDDVRALDSI